MKKIFVCLISACLLAGISNAQTSTASKDVALETLGSTSGLLTYQIYIGIGAIADGYTSEAYSKETVVNLMDEQISSCKMINEQFQKLLGSGFITSADDMKYVRDFIATVDLLSNEANALKVYVNDKTDANSASYQSYREKAWKSLSGLIGIEE